MGNRTRIIIVLFLLLVSLSACGLVPVPKQGLLDGEKLAVDIESVTFYEKLLKGEEETREVDIYSPKRTDEYAKVFVEKVKEVLPVAFQERGVAVVSGAPIKVKVSIAEDYKSSTVIRLMTCRTRGNGGKELVAQSPRFTPDPARSLFAPNSWRNLSAARFAAGSMSEVLANSLIILLRESGGLGGK